MCEPQEIKRTARVLPGPLIALSDKPKVHDPGLRGVERKAKLHQPLLQCPVNPLAVLPVLKHADRIVGKANEAASALESRGDSVLKPDVQHVVEKDIGQHRRSYSPLLRSFFRMRQRPLLKNPRLEPLIDQSSDDSILHPLVERSPEVTMFDRPEIIRDVEIQYPFALPLHDVIP